jgi:DNA-binding response OmpR family regulator
MGNKILIIEDEADLVENIRTILENFGYSVFTASNGVEGLKFVIQIKPDLIICDIKMPYKDGYAVINELQQNYDTALIPFIFLTGKTDIKDMRKGMELGANDYLFKPFAIEELIATIETRLRKSSVYKKVVYGNRNPAKDINNNDRILVNINNSKKILKFSNIVYILAERQYTNIVIREGRNIVVRKSLNEWEKVLPGNNFIRINRSTIINTDYINRFQKYSNTYRAILADDSTEFDVSRRYFSRIKSLTTTDEDTIKEHIL